MKKRKEEERRQRVERQEAEEMQEYEDAISPRSKLTTMLYVRKC